MKIPLEERTKWPYQGYEENDTIYASKPQSDVSSGEIYTNNNLYRLNNKTVYVQNDGKPIHEITVNLELELFQSIITISNEFKIDPTLILAVMAHESGFDKSATSEAGAMGLMQNMPLWFYANAEPHKDFIISLDGNYNDPYDPITNIVSWCNGLKTWFKTYGETEEALYALRQGYKGSGWTKGAILNGQEFLDIKRQLDAYLFN